MIRSTARRLAAAILLFGFASAPAFASGQAVTLTDQRDNAIGTTTNPLNVALPAGSGASTANQGAPNLGGSAAWFVQWAGQSIAVSSLPSLPSGSNSIGAVTQGAAGVAPWLVSWSGQSIAVTALPSLPAGTNTIGTVNVLGGNSTAVKTDGSAVTQPVSAVVLPLPTNAAAETGGNLATLAARTPALGVQPKAASRSVTIATDQGSIGVADPNNAAYSVAGSTFATGATVTAGRAIYLACTGTGSVTMTLSGGGSIAWPITSAGPYTLPFAVTSVSADTASCSHQNIS